MPPLDNASNLLIITSMPYTNRPFQPETPYANQVSIELNKANDNFDILAQAFVSDNPETFKVKNANNSDTASNSDKVDGYDASLTPAPNIIVPLNSAGILDLSATYVKSNVYTFRRVNLTGATSDYELQVGEEAYIEFSNATTVPLRINISSGSVYSFYLCLTGVSNATILPNNTSYSSQFRNFYLIGDGNDSVLNTYSFKNYTNGFYVVHNASFSQGVIYTQVSSKLIHSTQCRVGGNDVAVNRFYTSAWLDTTTPWTSFGTITAPENISGYILVRRLR